MVEYLGEPNKTTDITYLPTIPNLSGPVIKFHLNALGIGDAVCALYSACGLANAGHKVQMHTRHLAWLTGVSHPGVDLLLDEQKPFDASCNYRDQLYAFKRGELRSRPDWYIRNICQAYGIEPVDPARPDRIPTGKRSNYVLLAPFSNHETRDWGHFRILARRLLERNIKVVVIGSESQRQKLYDVFYGLEVERHIGKTPAETMQTIASAAVVVANDSGAAHLGGLCQVPTLCLMAQYDRAYTFICADTVQAITSDMSCVGCHTILGFGWEQGCNRVCSALQVINPERVFNRVMEMYEAA